MLNVNKKTHTHTQNLFEVRFQQNIFIDSDVSGVLIKYRTVHVIASLLCSHQYPTSYTTYHWLLLWK